LLIDEQSRDGKGDVMARQAGNRIAVVGSTGSGKTTLARQIAACFAIPHVELDALHWDANWTEAPPDIFRDRVNRALVSDRWVTDGNYQTVRDIIWRQADTLAWLDYELPLIFVRLFRRTMQRVFRQEVLWNGNREQFATHFFTRDSLFLWLLKSYGRRRREYSALLQQPEYAHLSLIHLKTPKMAQQWLVEIGCDN
jgi:adenylate kinase family enzyme